ncbi:MAG: RiPP maturation radical SAM C-methyltransferase [Thermodesulfobacteriota bacterium]
MMPPNRPFHVELISMPWAAFHRPSVQLGALAAFLRSKDAGVQVRCRHPSLGLARDLGKDLYHSISANVWVCEALYAALLFPEQREQARRLAEREFRAGDSTVSCEFDRVCALLEKNIAEWLEKTEWATIDLVGFSVCFNQLFATLATVRALKEIRPDLPVVLGGSACHAGAAPAFFRLFSVDYLISGEGEEPLFSLCRHLAGQSHKLHARVHHADRGEATTAGNADDQLDMALLPRPDYDDYFREMETIFPGRPFVPTLPVEFSRGCWWRKCTFCNLNLQWHGYRWKKAENMAAEVAALAARHRSLDFAFTDNALPPAEALAFFAAMAASGRDYRFFGEIRADYRGARLSRSRAGGLTAVQVGIEAFSNSLLRRFAKGVTVIDNLAIMRDAAASGVVLDGNLIVEFPGSTGQEVEETLMVLDFVLPFHPLTTASFFLGHGSPVDCRAADHGILATMVHPRFAAMLPAAIAKAIPFLIKGYRGDRGQQRRLWRPVVDKVRNWRHFHEKQRPRGNSLLCRRDGGDFLIIRQVRDNGEVQYHRLAGLSRRIYHACDEIVSLAELAALFPALPVDRIEGFLLDLVEKRLVFRDGDRFLALAARESG